MPIPLGILAAAGIRPAGAAGAYELIETVTVGSGGAASVTFSNLNTYSTTYQHLQIRYLGRTTRAVTEDGNPRIFLNGDTTLSNYRSHYLYGTGSSVVSFDNGQVLGLSSHPGNSAGSGQFLPQIVDLLDAYEAKNKTVRMLAGLAGSFNGVRLGSGVWFNTNAITSVQLEATSSSWAQGSRFSLYGLKASA